MNKWKEDQNNKTETGTEDKEKAEADDIRYQNLSRKTIRQWLHSRTLISLPHIAQALLNTSSEEVKMYGLYGTKKAAGVKLHDVKNDHKTVGSEEGLLYTQPISFLSR